MADPLEINKANLKKGRFSIENAKTENFTEKFGSFKRGRFTVNYTEEVENKTLFDILEGQQRQMEILFEIAKEANLNGENQLFYKEFQVSSEKVEENIEKLRRIFEHNR